MSRYPFDTREEAEKAAGAVADILEALGFTTMSADCRGPRVSADLPRYARVAVKNVTRDRPQMARAVRQRLSALGLI